MTVKVAFFHCEYCLNFMRAHNGYVPLRSEECRCIYLKPQY